MKKINGRGLIVFRYQLSVVLDSFKLCRHFKLIIAGDSLSLPCTAPINVNVGIEKKIIPFIK